MNQATPQAPALPSTNETPNEAVSYAERAANVFGPDEASIAGGEPANDAHGAVAPTAAPETEAQSAARAARRTALLQMQERERQTVDTKTAVRERDELRKQLATLSEQNKAYAAHIDPTKLTKDQFFALAEKNPELSPQELGEWLRERMANPEAAAARSAKAAVDPELSALRKQIAEQQAALDEFKTSHQTALAQADEHQSAQRLHAFVQENATTAPLTARFVAAKGIQGLYDAALSVAQHLPAGAGPQAILDELEERLLEGQRDYASIYGATATSSPQRQQAFSPPPNQAAAKAPMHVSNTLAQQRSSVVDEQADFAKLPLNERASRLFGT